MTTPEQEVNVYSDLLKALVSLDGEAEARTKEILAPVQEVIDNQRLIIQDAEKEISLTTALYQVELDRLSDEMARRRNELNLELAVQKAKVEVLTKAKGATLKGDEYMAVYTGPKWDWDGKKLEGFGAAHPEVFTCATKTEPKVVLRKR